LEYWFDVSKDPYFPTKTSLRPVVDSILPSLGEVVDLLNLIWPNTLRDPNHPQELIDVIAATISSAHLGKTYPLYPSNPPKMTNT